MGKDRQIERAREEEGKAVGGWHVLARFALVKNPRFLATAAGASSLQCLRKRLFPVGRFCTEAVLCHEPVWPAGKT